MCRSTKGRKSVKKREKICVVWLTSSSSSISPTPTSSPPLHPTYSSSFAVLSLVTLPTSPAREIQRCFIVVFGEQCKTVKKSSCCCWCWFCSLFSRWVGGKVKWAPTTSAKQHWHPSFVWLCVFALVDILNVEYISLNFVRKSGVVLCIWVVWCLFLWSTLYFSRRLAFLLVLNMCNKKKAHTHTKIGEFEWRTSFVYTWNFDLILDDVFFSLSTCCACFR